MVRGYPPLGVEGRTKTARTKAISGESTVRFPIVKGVSDMLNLHKSAKSWFPIHPPHSSYKREKSPLGSKFFRAGENPNFPS
jgi:hypothetical protein